MEITMDDMNESQAELEYEVTKIFEDLEEGTMLTVSQIDTLRYVCGFPKKRRVNPVLAAIADDFSNIFGGKQ
jgi:ATP-dependent RNA circularization protein (DNA/RNA ligase family)